MYESPLEWEELVRKLINHKSSLPESDPTYPIYTDVLNGKKNYIVTYLPCYVSHLLPPKLSWVFYSFLIGSVMKNYLSSCSSLYF